MTSADLLSRDDEFRELDPVSHGAAGVFVPGVRDAGVAERDDPAVFDGPFWVVARVLRQEPTAPFLPVETGREAVAVPFDVPPMPLPVADAGGDQ